MAKSKTRSFNGKLYARDAYYGAYGNNRNAAKTRADNLKADGWLVRITKERDSDGVWWITWKRKAR